MRYRPYLTHPDEALFLTSDPFDMLERAHQLSLDLGAGRHEQWASVNASVPLPVHNPDRGLDVAGAGAPGDGNGWNGWPLRWPDGRLVPAWPGAKPQMLWCPLFWLPNHLSSTLDVAAEDGSVTPEGIDEWALRVVFDLHTAGLYRIGYGWLDVLEPVGIDTQTATGCARVERWLTGVPDPVLDSFSLDSYFEQLPGWSLQDSYDAAVEASPVISDANLALAANRVLTYCDDIDVEDVPLFLAEVQSLSRIWLPGADEAIWAAGPTDGGLVADSLSRCGADELGRRLEMLRKAAERQYRETQHAFELLESLTEQAAAARQAPPAAAAAGSPDSPPALSSAWS